MIIAANRSPDSYVAGTTVIHRAEDSPRYSADLDLFHDLEDSVARHQGCVRGAWPTVSSYGHG